MKKLIISALILIFFHKNITAMRTAVKLQLQQRLQSKKNTEEEKLLDSLTCDLVTAYYEYIKNCCLVIVYNRIRSEFFRVKEERTFENNKAHYLLQDPLSDELISLYIKGVLNNKISVYQGSISKIPMDYLKELFSEPRGMCLSKQDIDTIIKEKIFISSFFSNKTNLSYKNSCESWNRFFNIYLSLKAKMTPNNLENKSQSYQRANTVFALITSITQDHEKVNPLLNKYTDQDKPYIEKVHNFLQNFLESTKDFIFTVDAIKKIKQNGIDIDAFLNDDLYQKEVKQISTKYQKLLNKLSSVQITPQLSTQSNPIQATINKNNNEQQSKVPASTGTVVTTIDTKKSIIEKVQKIYGENITSVTNTILTCKNQHGDLCTIYNLNDTTLNDLIENQKNKTLLYHNRVTKWWKASSDQYKQNSHYSWHSQPQCFASLFSSWGKKTTYTDALGNKYAVLYQLGKLQKRKNKNTEYVRYTTSFDPNGTVYHQFTDQYPNEYQFIAECTNETTIKTIFDEQFPKLES